MRQLKIVRPDDKGRITLGELATGVSKYEVYKKGNDILLKPFVEIPADEKWLFDNKSALAKVKQGLKDSAEGRVSNLGSFSKYAEDDKE